MLPQSSKWPTVEDDHTEFKSSHSRLEREIVAFANATGGTIYIGLNDDGTRSRFQSNNKIRSEIVTSITNCEPVPKYTLEETDGVLQLHILAGEEKPYKAPDGFFLRIGASCRKLSRDEILQIAINQNRVQFDSQVYSEPFTYAESEFFSPGLFALFRERSKLSPELDDLSLLRNLGLIVERSSKLYATYALSLCFSRKVSQIFPQVRLICWQIADDQNIVDQRVISGDLMSQLTSSFAYVTDTLRQKFEIKSLRRREEGEFPEFVVRELLVNAIIHRDYFEKGAEVQIKISRHALEISNPGNALSGKSAAEIVGHSVRRNPLIAEVFERAGYVERAGTGLLRVLKYLERMKMAPLSITQEGIFFVATLMRESSLTIVAHQTQNQRQSEALTWIESARIVRSREYAKRFKISTRLARRELAMLVEMGLLVKRRKGREQFYEIVLR